MGAVAALPLPPVAQNDGERWLGLGALSYAPATGAGPPLRGHQRLLFSKRSRRSLGSRQVSPVGAGSQDWPITGCHLFPKSTWYMDLLACLTVSISVTSMTVAGGIRARTGACGEARARMTAARQTLVGVRAPHPWSLGVSSQRGARRRMSWEKAAWQGTSQTHKGAQLGEHALFWSDYKLHTCLD